MRLGFLRINDVDDLDAANFQKIGNQASDDNATRPLPRT